MTMSRFSAWRLVLMGCTVAACSSSGDSDAPAQRAGVLSFTAGQIAQAALSDAPNADFVSARTRVEKLVPTMRAEYARLYKLGAGRMPISSDTTFSQLRVDAATALGTRIDPQKASDPTSAGPSLDALLAEVNKINAAAQSCNDLPAPKNDSCAYALIIIEVHRAEAAVTDAGAAPQGDAAATPVADAGPSDASVPVSPVGDAGPSAPVNLFSCASHDSTGAVLAKNNIDADTTWSGKVLVKGDTYQSAGTLTIAPGTQVFMDVDSTLALAWNSSIASVIADAPASAPILFCGTNAAKGAWGKVTLGTKVGSNSVLRNVLFSDGGGTDAALELLNGVTLDNVQVRNSLKDGVWAVDFKAGSKSLSIEGSGASAVVLKGEGALTNFPLGGMLLNNVANEAVIRFGSFSQTTVIHNIGIPYVEDASMYQSAGDLTFEAGVDYRFKTDVLLELAWNSSAAGVHANGTAQAPVKFGPWQPGVALWAGLTVGTKVTSNSNFTYAEITQAGSTNKPAIELSAAVLLDHLTLTSNNVGASIKVAPAVGSKNLTITKTKGRPLAVATDAVFRIPQGGTFTGNDNDQIEITGDTFNAGDGTIADLGVPYFIGASIDTYKDSHITIAPGTDFVMGVDTLLTIGWNSSQASLIAKGTAALPITFTGATPTAGSWKGIQIGTQVLSTTVLDYVQIGHAGGGAAGTPAGALEIKAPSPSTNSATTVTNSKFYQSAGFGILKAMAIATDYNVSNTFENDASGNVGIE